MDTGQLLRWLVIGYHEAVASGRDDQLLRVQQEAAKAVDSGVAHDDLILLLAQVHLDSHDLAAAEQILSRFDRAGQSADGLILRSALLRQQGQLGAAGRVLFAGSRRSPRRSLGLAGLYDDLGVDEAADGWYAAAAQDLDAKQLGLLTWIQIQRARLRRRRGDLPAAGRHLHVAECAGGGWGTLVERARWQEACGQSQLAAGTWQDVVRRTGRPDHRHALAGALRRCGRDRAADHLFTEADEGYRRLSVRLPWRYLHHRVQWHLDVDGDLDAAVELGWRDFAARPNPHTGRRLVGVLSARGEERAASELCDDLDRRRDAALAELGRIGSAERF